MHEFTRNPDDGLNMKPGEWRVFRGRIAVVCPKCGEWYRLNHAVSDAGVVNPSLDCPTPGCDFHEMGVLKDFAATTYRDENGDLHSRNIA